jgi:hypothetical protein
MSTKIAEYVQGILSAFVWLASFHKAMGQKNVLGQLLQNKGGSFSLSNEAYHGVSWQSKKQALDSKRKEKSQNVLDWPDTINLLSQQETGFGNLFVGYIVTMFVTKLSWRDIFTGMFLAKAFPTKETWDKWTADKGFSILLGKEHSTAYIPEFELIQQISAVCTKLAEIRGYNSIDNVSGRESIDMSMFDL